MDNYGQIIFKLDELIEKKHLSKNKLSELTGLSFTGIQRYYNGTNKRVDLDVLARLCYALDCNIEDIIEYRK
ncbi:MAG: helix-turn-helix domain-containing protein [Lachnospiraceae bacterium]